MESKFILELITIDLRHALITYLAVHREIQIVGRGLFLFVKLCSDCRLRLYYNYFIYCKVNKEIQQNPQNIQQKQVAIFPFLLFSFVLFSQTEHFIVLILCLERTQYFYHNNNKFELSQVLVYVSELSHG